MDEEFKIGRGIIGSVFVWIAPGHIAPLNLDPHTKNIGHILDFSSLLQELRSRRYGDYIPTQTNFHL